MRTNACWVVTAIVISGCAGHRALPVADHAPLSSRTVRNVLVLSLRSPAQPPGCSTATLASEVFTDAKSVRAYFEENSYGCASISGMVSGPYTIAMGNTCALTGWANQADSVAMAAGVRVSDYNSIVYILPPESTDLHCTPGRNARNRIWIRADVCDSKNNIAHELGHAFGAGHSGREGEGVAQTDQSAAQRAGQRMEATIDRQVEYGDLSSVMGGILDGLVDEETRRALFNATPHFTAPQKIRAGWLPAGNVQTVTESGNYRVALLEKAVSDVQVVKIVVGDSVYYASYRRAVGFDSALLGKYVDRTSIHTANGGVTTLHATLDDGQTYRNGQLAVRQVRHNRSYAYLDISVPKRR